MNRFDQMWTPRVLMIAVAGLLMTSCAQVEESWLPGGMSAAAKDQIMLVRQEPASFGFQRLQMESRVYPDLGFFVSKHGVPNFLAETGNRERRYFILYYLKERRAYACRTHSIRGNTVEFAGPYPITDREFRLLDGFRRDPSHHPGPL